MAGRKPKPTALKLLHGNPGKRPLNKKEPNYKGKRVKLPVWVPKAAKEEFKRIVAVVSGIDLLNASHQASLEAYCVAYARWKTAEAIVTAEGQLVMEPIVNKTGDIVGHKIKRHPATIIALAERESMRKAAGTFGFDPSSQSRVQLPDGEDVPEDENSDDDLYGGSSSKSSHISGTVH